MPIDLNSKPVKPNQEHPDDALIEDARMAAASDWEETFVADILDRRAKYGVRMVLTEAQKAKLAQIAEGIEDDLFSRKPRFGRR